MGLLCKLESIRSPGSEAYTGHGLSGKIVLLSTCRPCDGPDWLLLALILPLQIYWARSTGRRTIFPGELVHLLL